MKLAIRVSATCDNDAIHADMEVVDLATASASWRSIRDFHEFGSSAMLPGCGNVSDEGVVFAHVSYTGRVWVGPQGKGVLVKPQEIRI